MRQRKLRKWNSSNHFVRGHLDPNLLFANLFIFMPILLMSNKDAEDAENESDQNSFAFHKEKGGLPGMAEQGGKRGGG